MFRNSNCRKRQNKVNISRESSSDCVCIFSVFLKGLTWLFIYDAALSVVLILRLPDGSMKRARRLKKMLLVEFQNYDIENCLVSFPICPVRFNNLPSLNRPFIAIWAIFCRKPSAKTSENGKQDFLCSPSWQ